MPQNVNFQMKRRNGAVWDLLFPATKADLVQETTEKKFVSNTQISAWDAKPDNKEDIGLGNVDNKSSETIRGEITTVNITTALGYTPAELDGNGKVLIAQIPDIAKQATHVVDTIAQRDALTNLIAGEKAFILDDGTDTGNSYIWDGVEWRAMSKADWENINLQWENIANVPLHIANTEEAFTTALKTKLDGVDEAATKVEESITNGNIKISGTETNVYTHPGEGTNPHGTTKEDVNLGNVENYAPATTQEAEAGTATDKYMTPSTTKDAITTQIADKQNQIVVNSEEPVSATTGDIWFETIV